MSKQPTATDVANAWLAGVEQCAEATGVELVWVYQPLLAFAFRRPLSNELHFCCLNEDREKVQKLWEERNTESGSLV